MFNFAEPFQVFLGKWRFKHGSSYWPFSAMQGHATTSAPKVAVDEAPHKPIRERNESPDGPPLLFLARSGQVIDLGEVPTSVLHMSNGGPLVDLGEKFTAPATAASPPLNWHRRRADLSKLPHYYMALSKMRLTGEAGTGGKWQADDRAWI